MSAVSGEVREGAPVIARVRVCAGLREVRDGQVLDGTARLLDGVLLLPHHLAHVRAAVLEVDVLPCKKSQYP